MVNIQQRLQITRQPVAARATRGVPWVLVLYELGHNGGEETEVEEGRRTAQVHQSWWWRWRRGAKNGAGGDSKRGKNEGKERIEEREVQKGREQMDGNGEEGKR